MKPVVFTDLDGTLLDADDYTFDRAQGALDLIGEHGVPLVLCSSKTRTEIEFYRTSLGNSDPFVTENGGGIFVPSGYFSFEIDGKPSGDYSVITLGTPYQEVRRAFKSINASTGARCRGFGDMSVEEVASITGLDPREARLCKERDFSEPFIVEGGEECAAKVVQEIERMGFSWSKGRFYTIHGRHDKGAAIRILSKYFVREYGSIVAIGLGDGLNDVSMLKAVDRPVLVQRPDRSYAAVELPGLLKAGAPGPAGFRSALEKVLADLLDS